MNGHNSETTPKRAPSGAEEHGPCGIDIDKAQRGTRLLLESIGADPSADQLEQTWKRRVPAFFETFSEGLRDSAKPTIRTFEADTSNLIIKTDIPLYSLCEHHLLPFHGTAHVAYRPAEAVAGLSKLTRYVRWHGRRPTMQEQLTTDIANGLADELDAPVVLVQLEATHLCESMRGVETPSVTTTRSSVGAPTETERDRFADAISDLHQ